MSELSVRSRAGVKVAGSCAGGHRALIGIKVESDSTNALKQHCKGGVKRYPLADNMGRMQEMRVLAFATLPALTSANRHDEAAFCSARTHLPIFSSRFKIWLSLQKRGYQHPSHTYENWRTRNERRNNSSTHCRVLAVTG